MRRHSASLCEKSPIRVAHWVRLILHWLLIVYFALTPQVPLITDSVKELSMVGGDEVPVYPSRQACHFACSSRLLSRVGGRSEMVGYLLRKLYNSIEGRSVEDLKNVTTALQGAVLRLL